MPRNFIELFRTRKTNDSVSLAMLEKSPAFLVISLVRHHVLII